MYVMAICDDNPNIPYHLLCAYNCLAGYKCFFFPACVLALRVSFGFHAGVA